MVTLTVTPSRIAGVLHRAADIIDADGWHPYLRPLMAAIDTAADCRPGSGDWAAEEASLQAWAALTRHLDGTWPGDWELQPGRTHHEVTAALRGAANTLGGNHA